MGTTPSIVMMMAYSVAATEPRVTSRTALIAVTSVIDIERPWEGANKRGNSSRLTQSFHFFMFEPIFSPVNALNQPI